jgi:putative ABC transport system permease protein
VLGATDGALRKVLVTEAVLACLLSFGASLFLLHWVSLTPATNLLSSDLILSDNIPLLFIIGFVVLLTGVFAGIYPAYYATSFPPAMVLKGSFGLSLRRKKLRSTLIGVQFVASFFLIVAALFMYMQTYYMQHHHPGYDRSRLISVATNKQFADQYELFANELQSLPGIESVCYSEALLSSRDQYDTNQGQLRESPIIFNSMRVDVDFLQTIDIPLLEGRYFNKSDRQVEGEYFIIFNERARKEYNLQIGDKIDGVITVVGFVPDINYTSLRKEIEPMGFFLDPTRRFAYVRIEERANPYVAMKQIESTLERLSPGYPFDIRPLDDVSDSLYAFESNLMSLVIAFSLLAVMLSMIGVFGMVIFESEYKRKEIGIRKVFGSTTKQIIEMLNKRYIYLSIVCFIIAAPLSWYAIHLWLQSFAYKTPMYWWIFAVTFLLVTTLASATVTFQSWRVANANPVDSLKTE